MGRTVCGQTLLVDENLQFLDSTRDVFEDEAYRVAVASRGEEALQLAAGKAFDVIFICVVMPARNGAECCFEMKKHDPDVRVIMLTNYGVGDLARRAR